MEGVIMLRRTSKILVGAGALGIVLGGCGNNSPLDAKNPVSIDIWTYYNGDQLTAFDALVEEFNETVGKEKGIVVKGYSQGSVNDLESNVLAAVQGEVGADEVPNIFAAYADTVTRSSNCALSSVSMQVIIFVVLAIGIGWSASFSINSRPESASINTAERA